VLYLELSFYDAENWILWKKIRNIWIFLKCGAGERWRKLV